MTTRVKIMHLLPIALILTLLIACRSNSISSYTGNIAQSQGRDSYIAVSELYSNYDYAYSMSLPSKIVGCRESSPAPNHGIGIDLSEKSCRWMEHARNGIYPASYISIDASYNALEWRSPDEAAEAHLGYLKNNVAKSASIVQRMPTKLSNLPALRFVIHYDVSEVRKVEEFIVAFRKEKGTQIVYTLNLITSVSRYDEDEKVLGELRQNWKLLSLH